MLVGRSEQLCSQLFEQVYDEVPVVNIRNLLIILTKHVVQSSAAQLPVV